jgi:hypothetical protein
MKMSISELFVVSNDRLFYEKFYFNNMVSPTHLLGG